MQECRMGLDFEWWAMPEYRARLNVNFLKTVPVLLLVNIAYMALVMSVGKGSSFRG